MKSGYTLPILLAFGKLIYAAAPANSALTSVYSSQDVEVETILSTVTHESTWTSVWMVSGVAETGKFLLA